MNKFFQILPVTIATVFLLFAVVSSAQDVPALQNKKKPANAVKHFPTEIQKGTAKGNIGNSNNSNERIKPQSFSNQPVDITKHKIHPDLIRSEKIINQEIKTLKVEIKKNKSAGADVRELKKQLITLKSTKKHLQKNNLN